MTIEQMKETAEYLRSQGVQELHTAIVLGTGLGNFVSSIQVEKEIPYENIPHFPLSTVEFHSGKLLYGTVKGKKLLAMNGRFHFYEGYSMQQITFPIRVMGLLGIRQLLISNAAGAMNLQWKKGDLMLVTDHINLLPSNPLIGKNENELGPRFPDMSEAYNKNMIRQMDQIAMDLSIPIRKGVYVSVTGPQLETPAEYRFLHRIGADAVGMSTVPEVIVANHMKIPVLCISVLTDECDPDDLQPINIEEIIKVAGTAEKKLTLLFEEFIARS